MRRRRWHRGRGRRGNRRPQLLEVRGAGGGPAGRLSAGPRRLRPAQGGPGLVGPGGAEQGEDQVDAVRHPSRRAGADGRLGQGDRRGGEQPQQAAAPGRPDCHPAKDAPRVSGRGLDPSPPGGESARHPQSADRPCGFSCALFGIFMTSTDFQRPARRPPRFRPVPHPGGADLHPAAGRSRRRRDQDRTARRRRRHAQMGPALSEGQGRQGHRRERPIISAPTATSAR